MSVNLSWDLFILAFFGVVTAYSFIIGRDQTLKIISGTYIAILASDAFGNLFEKFFISSPSFLKILKLLSIGNVEQAVAFFKVMGLVVIVVLIAVKGAYDFSVSGNDHLAVHFTVNLILGILSAGLMISAMLIFISGGSLINGVVQPNSPVSGIYAMSKFVRIMVDYSDGWFLAPAVGLVWMSIFSKK